MPRQKPQSSQSLRKQQRAGIADNEQYMKPMFAGDQETVRITDDDEEDDEVNQIESENVGQKANASSALLAPVGGRNDQYFGGTRDSTAFISMSIDAADGAGIQKFMQNSVAQASRFKIANLAEIDRRSLGLEQELNYEKNCIGDYPTPDGK